MPKAVKPTDKPISNIIKSEKDLANFIKYKRTKMGSTMMELSKGLNINYKTLSKLECGEAATRLSTALYVANMLGLEIIVREKGEK